RLRGVAFTSSISEIALKGGSSLMTIAGAEVDGVAGDRDVDTGGAAACGVAGADTGGNIGASEDSSWCLSDCSSYSSVVWASFSSYSRTMSDRSSLKCWQIAAVDIGCCSILSSLSRLAMAFMRFWPTDEGSFILVLRRYMPLLFGSG